ncbi:MAG: cold shock domain-containing protein [Anaerolineae bacterium]|nr:cold shock domain-containing protein [Anaerolineae bacterium]
MPQESRHQGYIVFYNTERGYGFIESKDFKQPLFFHYTFLEGAGNNPVYNDLYNGEDVKKIEVSFITYQDERGLQARQIKPVSEFAELESFISSPKAQGYFALDNFLKIVTMRGILHIDKDERLAQYIVQKIVHSPERWAHLVNIAKDWVLAQSHFTNSSLFTRSDTLSNFSEELVKSLGFEPLGKLDIQNSIPCGVQYLETSPNPLRIFRESKKLSLMIFPDYPALQRAVKKDINFINSNRTELKLLVLLDETGLNYDQFKEHEGINFAWINQMTIFQLILAVKEYLPIYLGRNLRQRFPLERLQPYQVGSEYDYSIFTGRSHEREKILEDISGNYAIYGGRKIGKTWFLKDICAKCRREPYSSIYIPFYISLQSAKTPEDAALSVIEVLEDYTDSGSLTEARTPMTGLVNAIKKVHKETGKTVLLAIDEFDDILKNDISGDFFGGLRKFQSNATPGTCKFIFSGFKELIYAFSDVISNNPFANWIGKNHFPLVCLSEQDLKNLITSPLNWAGYEFDSDVVIKTIYSLTSGHPYYTQSLCHAIVNAKFEKDPFRLTQKNIEQLASDEFFTEVFDIFLLNLSPLQLLIGKVFSPDVSGEIEPFSEQQIVDALREKFKFSFTQKEIREQMKILQACSVFTKSAAGYKPVIQKINQEFFKTQNDEDLAIYYLEEVENGISGSQEAK